MTSCAAGSGGASLVLAHAEMPMQSRRTRARRARGTAWTVRFENDEAPGFPPVLVLGSLRTRSTKTSGCVGRELVEAQNAR